MGGLLPPEQAEALDHHPALRHVRPGQAGQVGAREPGDRLLPPQVRLDDIVRHRMVAGRASPDDPALTGYWQQRRRRDRLPVDPATWHLLRRQRGRCPLCRGLLLHADRQPQSPEEWQQWHTVTRKAIRKHAIDSVTDLGTRTDASHTTSYTHTAVAVSAAVPARRFSRSAALRACLSRAAGKRARPVLRGPRRGNAPGC